VSTIDDVIAEAVTEAVTDAIARAEARGEERARLLKTHLSVAEAAESLGISDTHARSLIAKGDIPSVRLGDRIVVPRQALEALGC
jgi:excisionase family DNA binding protein